MKALLSRATLWTLTLSGIGWLPVLAHAQVRYGSIVVEARDPSGSAVPGADVTITETGTNLRRSGVTNSAGSYNIPFLLPGNYRVTAEITGFKKFVRDGVEVSVSESVEVNIAMQVGAVTESVETKADTAQLDTTGPSLGQVTSTLQPITMRLALQMKF